MFCQPSSSLRQRLFQLVSDQFSTVFGKRSRRHELPGLYANRVGASCTWFERNRWQENHAIVTA